MITKNHPSAYTDLFLKANEYLRKYGPDIYKGESFSDITNINEYFACLKDLADIENKSEAGIIGEYIDPIFTMLPATEETFNINANERSIKVPQVFKDHGVGVQGDEIAEILYFAIDSYFDAMDLADMDIIIQWKHASDGDNVSNLSATYKKSLTLQPGKIVFGWPISSEVTERPGDIQFSIRFYRRDEETKALIYSFSTLTATIKIRNGLDFELDEAATETAIKRNDKIYKNLRNSVYYDAMYDVAVPEFERYYTLEGSTFTDANVELTYDLPITFIAKAGIPANTPDSEEVSASGLTYTWYKDGEEMPMTSTIVYKEDPKTSYNPKEIYYIKVVDNQTVYYEPYFKNDDANPFDDVDENGEPLVLYTRHSSFVPSGAGVYSVVASNIYVPGSVASITSDKWTVPAPIAPSFTYGNTDRKVLLDEENGAVITIEPSITDNGSLSMVWLRSENADGSNSEVLADMTTTTCSVNAEGYYFLRATNTKNNSTAIENSLTVWARYDASLPVITAHSNGVSLGGTISIEVAEPLHSEGLTYQWYNTSDQPISGATAATYTPIAIGSYRCAVTNTYKGNNKTVVGNWITVTPAP